LQKENHLEKECIDCETMPNMIPTGPQSIMNILSEEEILSRASLFTKFSCSREAFNSLNSSTYYYLYHDLFNGLTLQKTTHHLIQINSIGLTPFEVLDGDDVHTEDRED
jgi:hypothetical protein